MEVSSDNRIYLPLNKSADSDYTFDFGTQSLNEHFYTFVKIRDIYDFNPLPDTSDHALGADIDAVVALNTAKRVTFKTDSLFSSEMVDLSEYGKKKLTDLADKIRILSQPVVIINAYSHQKASERYLSLSTYMQADIIRQFLYNQQELSLAEYYISGKGYDENLKYSIIEILIQQKLNEKSFNR